jgi:hypothetical protein
MKVTINGLAAPKISQNRERGENCPHQKEKAKKELHLANINAINIIYLTENPGINKENIQRIQSKPFLSAYKKAGCSSTHTPRWVLQSAYSPIYYHKY